MKSTTIRIKDRLIGPDNPCFIIAEAGINHNGSLEMAMRLVDVAVAAGVDAVKFITFNPDTLVTKKATKAQYQKTREDDEQTFYEMLKPLWLSYDAFRQLDQYARDKGIIFMSKGYIEEVDFLVELGVPVLKIDSASVVYYSLLRKAAKFGLPIILSTGGTTLGEVERAVGIISETGNHQVVLLHCTSAYPTPDDQVNLRAMVTLGNALGLNVGLSDHSQGIEVPLAAVALGAVVIEKHFTLDRSLPGPDHQASLEPDELRTLVKGVRKVEAALGNPRKCPTDLERENMRVVRRSLIAERTIQPGECFQPSMIAFKRPAGGLGEEALEIVLGRVATRQIQEGEPITWDVVGGPAHG